MLNTLARLVLYCVEVIINLFGTICNKGALA